MPLDSAFLLEVKEHVSAKLKNLGAFIDEELPDYIMVMVANNKSESSMAKDLQLFLGEHTVEFTKWLHNTLDKLKNRSSINAKSKEQESESGKSKSSRRRSRKTDSSSARVTQPRSRSRSPINRKSVGSRSSREPHEVEAVSLTVEDDNVDDDISSSISVREERKVVSTASLVSKTRAESQVASIDSTQENLSLHSVVKVRESEVKHRPKINKPANNSIQPTGRLLKQAVSEVKANSAATVSIHSRTKRAVADHPVEYGDVSSTGANSEKTKFFVTLSGAEPRSASPPDIDSSARWDPPTNRIGPVSSIKARLGNRRVVPYEVPKKLSAKQRLGPITVKRAVAGSLEFGKFDKPDVDDLDMVQEVEILEEESSFLPDSRTVGVDKIQLVDRFNQKQLVVSLNEADCDEDVAPLTQDRLLSKKKLPSTPVEAPAKIPNNLERCRYWPNCRNKDKCPYIHPSEPCSTFPRCRLGDECIYIHPTCRYDASCTRQDCPFAHTVKRTIKPVAPAAPLVPSSQVVCRYQDRCANSLCPFYHPPVARLHTGRPPSASIPCRFGSKCVNTSCPFVHPKYPTVNQLKWVAPSKQQQQHEGDGPLKKSPTAADVAKATLVK